jgi:hypothetical protein
MEINGEIAICVWQIEKRHVSQWNLVVEGIRGITSARWIISTESSDVVYAVSAETGYYEHRRDVVVRWENPLFDLATVSRDGNGKRYFFGTDGELRVIGSSEFFEEYEVGDAKFRVLPHMPIVKSYLEGECEVLACMHLYRCADCRRPLLYPLVSAAPDGLATSYCSQRCQENHWPQFSTVRHKADK